MKFTIDCETNIGKGPTLRLQKDSSWRKISWPEPIGNDDMEFDDASWAGRIVDAVKQVVYEGVTYEVEAPLGKSFSITGDGLTPTENYAEVFHRLHRSKRPYQFTLNEVRQAIAAGDDSTHNCLNVTIDGHVHLTDASRGHPKDDPIVAAAYPRFNAGNDYVGNKAARDADHIAECFNHLLQLWKEHLQTGRCGVLDDTFPPHDTNDLLAEIQGITEKLA